MIATPSRIPSEILDRLPPQNIQAERELVGALLIDPKIADRIAPMVRPDEFYSDAHQRLYRAILAMRDAGTAIGLTTLMEALKRTGELEAAGGAAGIYECINGATVTSAYDDARIIRSKAKRRALIHAATEMLRSAWNEAETELEIVSAADKALTEIVVGSAQRETLSAQESVFEVFDCIDETIRKGATAGLTTGFRLFDEEIGGLFPGELAILGARQGIGKTALAMQIAQWTAGRGELVYFVSLEMTVANLLSRELCSAAGVNSVRLRTGKIDEDERQRIIEAGNIVAQRPIVFDDRPELKVSDVRRKCRQLARDGLRLVVVDYTQFVTPEDGREPREQQVARIIKGLKAIAKELKIAVLALSALNREADKTGQTKVSHIRESDMIGYTADVVMTLERGEAEKANEAWWKVLKNRNGPVGKFEMEWIPHRTRFACKGEMIPDPVDTRPTNRETAFDAFGGTNGF